MEVSLQEVSLVGHHKKIKRIQCDFPRRQTPENVDKITGEPFTKLLTLSMYHKQQYRTHITLPVSYTHLDVYKRQIHGRDMTSEASVEFAHPCLMDTHF